MIFMNNKILENKLEEYGKILNLYRITSDLINQQELNKKLDALIEELNRDFNISLPNHNISEARVKN